MQRPSTPRAPPLCGFNNWRVPTRRELLSIVHHGVESPAIDMTFFPNTQPSFYWSSDIFAPVQDDAWGVNFGSSVSRTRVLTRAVVGGRVRLVSGTVPPEPNPRFVDNFDGTVTDQVTGLMWDRCAWGQTGTNCGGSASFPNWQDALGIAVEANTDNHRGYNDWRLPNPTELESLVDITRSNPAIDTNAFPNMPGGSFWSSTVVTGSGAAGAWNVSFGSGGTNADSQASGNHVRLVRSGQSFDALAPAALGMITEPSSAAQSGVPFPQQPVVEVRDVNGDAVLAAGTDITAAIDTGGNILAGTPTVATDANGRATFTDLAISDSVGDRTLSFSAGSLTPATSGTITLSAGLAAQMAINAGNGQNAVAGTAVATPPSVIVRDANNNPVAGASVTFAVASGGGSVTGEAATTNSSGIATLGSWTLGTAVGENTLTATSDGLTGSTVTFTATGTTGTATQRAINDGNSQSATAGTAVATAPSVIVRDANDNLVEGVSVTFAVASGDGTVDPTTPVATDANGIATVNSWTLGNTAGTNTLTASAGGLPDVTFSASSTTAPAAPTDVSATPGNAEATVSWTEPTDTGGSAITGYTVTGDPGGSCSVAGDVTECTITGLTNGTAYTFTVIATNAEGDGPPSIASESVTPVGPPGGSSQVRVEPTSQGLIVSWVAPSDNGGSPVVPYRAQANLSCEVAALADEVPGETAYSCTIGNLDPERDYTVTVRAINAAGEGTAVAPRRLDRYR